MYATEATSLVKTYIFLYELYTNISKIFQENNERYGNITQFFIPQLKDITREGMWTPPATSMDFFCWVF